jgi:cytoskeletal protein CcmA (bactofilin family)
MAQKNRATLKSYFQQGDIPTENEYIDLIDSIPSFQDHNSGDLKITGSLDILGNITASNVLLDWSGSGVTGGLLDGVYRINTQLIGSANGTSITFVNEVDFNNQNLLNIDIGSGDINNTSIGTSTPSSGSFTTLSSTGNTNLGNSVDDRHFFIGGVTGSSFLVQDVNGKGDFYAHEITVGDRSSNSNALTISTSGSLFASSSITSSANISASGTLYGSEAYITGHITASGNISASGTIFADNFQSTGGDIGGISFADEVNITGNITASGNISSSGTVFANALDLEGANIKYIASQNILKFGDAIKLGIGAGVTDAVGDLTISSDGANANLSANVGNIKLGTSAGNTIINNNFAGGNILLQSDKAGSGQQGGVVLISGSNTHISLDVRGNITASNISASGTLFANTLNASELTGITHITASGNISASGNLNAANITTPGTLTVGHLEATTINTLQLTSSIVTSSVIFSSGSNIFGDADSDTHTFNGSITASGDISSSGTINTQTLKVNDLTDGRVTFSSTNGRLADDSDLTFSNQTLTVTKIANIDTTHITASGNISSSGTVTADSVFTDLIQSTGTTGHIYTGAGITDVTIGYHANLNSRLKINSHVTASGTISASGTLYGSEAYITGHITASGNISGSTIEGQELISDGHITASGNISASGTGSFGYVEASGLVNRANDANTGLEFSSDTVVIQGNNVHAALFSSTLNRFIVPTQIQAPLTASSGISASHLKINSDAEGSFIELENGTFGAKIVASGSDYLVITSSGNSGGFYYDVRDNHLGVGRLPHISNASGLTVGGLTSGSRLHMSSHITASGNISASGDIFVKDLNINYDALPTSDPSVKGQVYRNGSNQLFVSAG